MNLIIDDLTEHGIVDPARIYGQGRFRRAMDMFANFRASPSTFRPTVRSRNRSLTATPSAVTKAESSPSAVPAAVPARSVEPAAIGHRGPTITYPFPLRTSTLAELTLPPDLTTREADRLAAFIKSLAVDDDDLTMVAQVDAVIENRKKKPRHPKRLTQLYAGTAHRLPVRRMDQSPRAYAVGDHAAGDTTPCRAHHRLGNTQSIMIRQPDIEG